MSGSTRREWVSYPTSCRILYGSASSSKERSENLALHVIHKRIAKRLDEYGSPEYNRADLDKVKERDKALCVEAERDAYTHAEEHELLAVAPRRDRDGRRRWEEE